MELLKQRILKDGIVKGTDILKVDSFLNHQMDIELLAEMGKEFKRLFSDCGVNKILTIESSGIGIACITAQYFDCPVVFAKKSISKNLGTDVYITQIESFTHRKTYDVIVSKEYIHPEDRILIIDDVLANGAALRGLLALIEQGGAKVVGAGIAIEKSFQPGGDELRSKGLRIESLARIISMDEQKGIKFID